MSAAQATVNHTLPIDYLLHLADNALVLGQRNAEWSGHGPILEEDIALSNNSLDLVGQARLLYQEAAAQIGNGATEDTLAFFRDVPDFKNYTLLELPNHSRDWLLRMGDGTAESHARAQGAVNHLMPYTQEFWTHSAYETEAARITKLDMASLQNDWNQIVNEALLEATLKRPADGGFVPTGKHSVHSEHLGFMLAEMQSLPRAHPNATW
jgi:ring-1,2-phenylacetyl-CoA epoxidase subunit PaaC